MDFELKAEEKINQLLGNVHKQLTRYPLFPNQQRQLSPDEEQLMANLGQDSFLYQSLLRLLAIETCSISIMNQIASYEQLNGMLASTLQSMNELGESFQKNAEKKNILEQYNKSTQSLVQCIRITQDMFPNSKYLEDQNKLIQTSQLQINLQEEILTKLRKQNQQLRKKAESNELQITNMQNKLTKLLKQHQGCQRGQGIGNTMTSIDLRQQLAYKEAQIQRMNEQFSFQIQKYNTVFQAMRMQLQELKSYQNVDLIEQIQLLQTEIVRLRQQQQRDQIIIKQLRIDNTVFSSSSGMYNSPRNGNSVRYQNSRFQY